MNVPTIQPHLGALARAMHADNTGEPPQVAAEIWDRIGKIGRAAWVDKAQRVVDHYNTMEVSEPLELVVTVRVAAEDCNAVTDALTETLNDLVLKGDLNDANDDAWTIR